MKPVELVPIDASGGLAKRMTALPRGIEENCKATASFYKIVGFVPPWIGYVSLAEGQAVGGGAFKGAPRDNKVEIAYYTLPEFEGQGFATATARALIAIAAHADPAVLITAQTLPLTNASNTLLRKIGFTFQGSVIHPEDGEVWEWHMNA
jgi:RimJ/RimL family protein N-acetyltransferase